MNLRFVDCVESKLKAFFTSVVNLVNLLRHNIRQGMTMSRNLFMGNYGIYGFEREKKWYEHEPQSVLGNEDSKILWDFTIQCGLFIQSRRPDIAVAEKAKNECKVIDIVVPNDVRVWNKEQEKEEKYQDLSERLAL